MIIKESVLKKLEDENCLIYEFSPNDFTFRIFDQLVHYQCHETLHCIQLTCNYASKSTKVIQRSKELTEKINELIVHNSTKRLSFLFNERKVINKTENILTKVYSDNSFYSGMVIVLLLFLSSSHFFSPLYKAYFVSSLFISWISLWILHIFCVDKFKEEWKLNLLFTGVVSLSFSFSLAGVFWIFYWVPLYLYFVSTLGMFVYCLYNFYCFKKCTYAIK